MKTRFAHYVESDAFWFLLIGYTLVPVTAVILSAAGVLAPVWASIAAAPYLLMALVRFVTTPILTQSPVVYGTGWSLSVRAFFIGLFLCLVADYWLSILGSTLAWIAFVVAFAGLAVATCRDPSSTMKRPNRGV